MAVKPLKDPRYRPLRLPGTTARRYLDTVTGETITRAEFERRTNPAKVSSDPSGRATEPAKTQAAPGFTQADQGGGSSGLETQPVVEAPPPPPVIEAASLIGEKAEALAAAAKKSSDHLANMVADGIAMCVSFMAQATLPDHLQYYALPADAWGKVLRPAGRIVARHMPVHLNASPDGEDMVALFNGVMFCFTAVAANKVLYKQQLRERYAHVDTNSAAGSGDREASPSSFAGSSAGMVQQPGSQPTAVYNTVGGQRAAGGITASSGDSPADISAKTALIRQLYEQDAARRRQRRGL